MPDTLYLLVPDPTLPPPDELLELTGRDNVLARQDAMGQLVNYTITWDDVTLQLHVPTGEAHDAQLNAFLLQTDELLGERKDKKARKIWRRAERMVRLIACTVTPEWDAERKAQLIVQGVMAYYDYALLWADGTVYNENGNIEVGHEQSKPKYFARADDTPDPAGEAQVRKTRSIKHLKAEGVPYIAHLPPLPEASQVTLRPLEVVAQRAMALNLIARRAGGESLAWYQHKIAQYRLQDAVTDDEMDFAQEDDPNEYGLVKFTQRYESYWLLLWALGFVNDLARPDHFCNIELANAILDDRSPDQFLLEASLRPVDDILDAADLYYRYHWAVIDADLYGKKPPRGLEPPVVYERHYALNWLMHYHDLAWDLVTTDT